MIVLASDDARAEVSTDGAELRSWQVAETPLIWTPDPKVWPDTAPLLFPVVGWTRGDCVTVDGVRYPLGLHGFVRRQTFRVLEQWPAHVRLGLEANDETRALYPFEWRLEIEYAIDGPMLSVSAEIRNAGSKAMPYAFGLHPGFRWPFVGGDMQDYSIVFGERELGSVPVISSEGLFTRQTRKVQLDGRRLRLSASLMDREALCFLDAKSRSLRFAHASGAAIDVELENFPHIALWSRPVGRFLSVEAWTGHGDFVDADGDLHAKPSMRCLAPGASAVHAAKFFYRFPHVLFR